MHFCIGLERGIGRIARGFHVFKFADVVFIRAFTDQPLHIRVGGVHVAELLADGDQKIELLALHAPISEGNKKRTSSRAAPLKAL